MENPETPQNTMTTSFKVKLFVGALILMLATGTAVYFVRMKEVPTPLPSSEKVSHENDEVKEEIAKIAEELDQLKDEKEDLEKKINDSEEKSKEEMMALQKELEEAKKEQKNKKELLALQKELEEAKKKKEENEVEELPKIYKPETSKDVSLWDLKNKIIEVTPEQYVYVTNLPQPFYGDMYRFLGTADIDVDKIVVTFENPISNLSKDEFSLRKYKKRSGEWFYEANKKYDVLDEGLNIYTVTAYKGEQTSVTKILLLNVQNEHKDQKTGLYYPAIESTLPFPIAKFSVEPIYEELDSGNVTDFVLSRSRNAYWHSFRKVSDTANAFYTLEENEKNVFEYYKNYYLSFHEEHYYGKALLETKKGEYDLQELHEEYRMNSRNDSVSTDLQQTINAFDTMFGQMKKKKQGIDERKIFDAYEQASEGMSEKKNENEFHSSGVPRGNIEKQVQTLNGDVAWIGRMVEREGMYEDVYELWREEKKNGSSRLIESFLVGECDAFDWNIYEENKIRVEYSVSPCEAFSIGTYIIFDEKGNEEIRIEKRSSASSSL